MALPSRKKPAGKKTGTGKYNEKAYIIKFWKGFAGFVAFVIVYFFMISMGWLGFMPSFKQLENPDPLLSSEIYSKDEVLIGKYFIQNRSNITFEELPPYLVDALIATEDARFYEHSGIDGRSLARVFFKTFLLFQRKGGGSTITQQLAKNLFPRDEDLNFIQLAHRKFKEWVIAVKLEKRYTKQELIAFYLNTVEFNKQAFGIKSASEVNFGKSPDKLSVEEAAVLVGMLQNPSVFNPLKNPDNALRRRNIVLGQMAKYEKLQEGKVDSLQKLPMKVKKGLYNAKQGLAPYFTDALRIDLLKWCREHKKPDGTAYDLYGDGLKIYTSIDSRMQVFAEEALRSHVKKMQEIFYAEWKDRNMWKSRGDILERAKKESELYRELKSQGLSAKEIEAEFNKKILMNVFSWDGGKQMEMSRMDSIKYYKQLLQAGLMAMEPQNGEIKAWVGGIDFNYFQYDHVRMGKRQVGSTFKPIVYAFAIENQLVEPCTEVPNTRICLHDNDTGEWCPENSNKDFDDRMVTVKFAAVNSLNRVSVYLIDKAGPSNVIAMARNMGIESNMRPYPSLALGVCDASLWDMVAAYAVYANEGNYVEPHYLLRIEDKNGKVLAKFGKKERQAINQRTAEIMCQMMKGVVDGEIDPVTGKKSGTGLSVRSYSGLGGDIAGKTGTTQNNSDGWFMGFTPQLVCGVWMGCEDPDIHFVSTASGQGSKTALPIWASFMSKVYSTKGLPYSRNKQFVPIDSTAGVIINCPLTPVMPFDSAALLPAPAEQ